MGNEFYEEEIVVDEQTGTARRAMKRITENLTREASSINSNNTVLLLVQCLQVVEALPHPALSYKLPVVFYQLSDVTT